LQHGALLGAYACLRAGTKNVSHASAEIPAVPARQLLLLGLLLFIRYIFVFKWTVGQAEEEP
jgi:hypothetical protein